MAFIIMDFVDGQNLIEHGFKDRDKWIKWGGPTGASRRVYRQLSELFLELRKQEFPRIGVLSFDAGGPSEANPLVCMCAIDHSASRLSCKSARVNSRQKDSQSTRHAFDTASEYLQSLLWLLENELDRSTNPDIDVDGGSGGMLLYAAHDFRRFVTEKWFHASKDDGPFVLMHGDLHNHYSNMLWDQDLNFVGVVDWEWRQIVPLQLFTPPVWLENTTVDSLAIDQWLFQKENVYLLEEVRLVENARGGPDTLSKEWAKMKTWCHPLVVSALFRPKDVCEVYWAFLSQERFEVDDPQTRPEVMVKAVGEWEKSEDIQAWMKQKRAFQKRYYEEEYSYVFLDEEKGKLNGVTEAN